MGTAVDTANRPAATPVPAAPSCAVFGWKVFVPGYHKGRYYSAADNQRTVANFARLSKGENPYLLAKAKLGHDQDQRLAQSLGFPSMGTITDCRSTPDGGYEIDVRGIPLAVGAEINAGRINAGSVEYPPELSDPDDPSKMVQGPVLAGVAFLGEEQPAVKGNPPPKAVLDDGAAVPGSVSPERSVMAMLDPKGGDGASLSQAYVEIRGRRVSVGRMRCIRFSEVIPVNRDQILAQLGAFLDVTDPAIANLADDALAALVKQMTDPAFAQKVAAAAAAGGPANPPVDAPGGDPPAPQMAEFMASCKKQFGALDQAVTGIQSQLAATAPALAAAAAFSADYKSRAVADKKARAEREVAAVSAKGHVIPVDRAMHVTHLLSLDDTLKFAEGATVASSPFDTYLSELWARPIHPGFTEIVVDETPASELDAFTQAALKSSRFVGKKILATAAAAK